MAGYVRIGNIRSGEQIDHGEIAVRVDRANPVLGNPHKMQRRQDLRERERVIADYADTLEADRISDGPMSRACAELAARVKAGEGLVLMCWCAPLPCHGDVIAKAIMRLAQEDRQQNSRQDIKGSVHFPPDSPQPRVWGFARPRS